MPWHFAFASTSYKCIACCNTTTLQLASPKLQEHSRNSSLARAGYGCSSEGHGKGFYGAPTTPSTSIPGLRRKTPIHPHSQRQQCNNEWRCPSRRPLQLMPSAKRSSRAVTARAMTGAGYINDKPGKSTFRWCSFSREASHCSSSRWWTTLNLDGMEYGMLSLDWPPVSYDI